MIDLGFFVLVGWEGDDLIDDEDEVGLVVVEVVVCIEKGDVEEEDCKVVDFKVIEG